jgi:hypothetical protein
MSGRRNHERYVVVNGNGSLSVVRDVTIWHADDNEFVATSEAPAIAGELLTLERIVDGEMSVAQVFVLESRPMFVNGRLRHRLLLRVDDHLGGIVSSANPRAH